MQALIILAMSILISSIVVLSFLVMKLFREIKAMKQQLNENFTLLDDKCATLFRRTRP